MRTLIWIALAGCGGEATTSVASGPARATAKVSKGEIKDRVLLSGELKAGAATEVTVPKTDAWELTIRWMAEDGAQVKAGDRVLEFDNSAFTNGLVYRT